MNRVIFDIDGTLTATTGVDDACFVAAIAGTLGFRVADTDWANYDHSTDHGLTVELCRRHIDRDPTMDEVAAVKERFVSLLGERIGSQPALCRPVPGAKELLAHMRMLAAENGGSGGWALGIASGAWPESAGVKLAAAGLDIEGLPATFSHGDAAGKPASREAIIQRTVSMMGGMEGAESTVYVGDGAWDARAARRLGIGFVGVRHDGRRARLHAEGVERIVTDYRDLGATVALLAEACAAGPSKPVRI